MFFGSDSAGERAAILYSLIETCKLNHIDPQRYLHYVLERIADHPITTGYPNSYPGRWLKSWINRSR